MPTYDYECDACQHKFEAFQNMSEEPLAKCPQCKKKKLRRLFGAGAALVFKGSGFYQTDYRSDSYKKAAESDKKPAGDAPANPASESKGESKGEGKSGESKPKSESKPESKSDSKPTKKDKS